MSRHRRGGVRSLARALRGIAVAMRELRDEVRAQRQMLERLDSDVGDAFAAEYESGAKDTRKQLGVGDPASAADLGWNEESPGPGWKRSRHFWVSPVAAFLAGWLSIPDRAHRAIQRDPASAVATFVATAAVAALVWFGITDPGEEDAVTAPNRTDVTDHTPTPSRSPTEAPTTADPTRTGAWRQLTGTTPTPEHSPVPDVTDTRATRPPGGDTRQPQPPEDDPSGREDPPARDDPPTRDEPPTDDDPVIDDDPPARDDDPPPNDHDDDDDGRGGDQDCLVDVDIDDLLEVCVDL